LEQSTPGGDEVSGVGDRGFGGVSGGDGASTPAVGPARTVGPLGPPGSLAAPFEMGRVASVRYTLLETYDLADLETFGTAEPRGFLEGSNGTTDVKNNHVDEGGGATPKARWDAAVEEPLSRCWVAY
jgi:hypothetical protein